MHGGKVVSIGSRAAVVAILALGAAACGGDTDADTPTRPSALYQDVSASIFNNHGHVALVTGAQIAAGRAISMDIRGSADHGHTLDLTDDDVIRLRQRQRVERDVSRNNGHTHRVTFY